MQGKVFFMTKCDNCENPAAYVTDDPSTRPQRFCDRCLPWHLRKRASLGLFRNPNGEPPAVEEAAPAPKRKKKADEPVVEEPVVVEEPAPVADEPVVEEVVAEAPAEA